jgi:hypothetical protein
LLTYFIVLNSSFCLSQKEYSIETSDIDNFWGAYDALVKANSKSDSIKIIQDYYIDKASEEFKEFIRIRKLTPEEYVEKIGQFPNFWKSIRLKTEQIKNRKLEIAAVFKDFEQELPGFKIPKVCFAIGCLRTGGTISKDLILIGSEIASADNSVDKSELADWLKSVIGKTGDITSMVAHETIHTQQINKKKLTLLTAVMNEGVADFISFKILNKNINSISFEYGMKNECKLIAEFLEDLKSDSKDYSDWVYNGGRSEERPADLGYFIGFRIAEAYYEKQEDKRKALTDLLDHKKYKRIYKESKYAEKSCAF